MKIQKKCYNISSLSLRRQIFMGHDFWRSSQLSHVGMVVMEANSFALKAFFEQWENLLNLLIIQQRDFLFNHEAVSQATIKDWRLQKNILQKLSLLIQLQQWRDNFSYHISKCIFCFEQRWWWWERTNTRKSARTELNIKGGPIGLDGAIDVLTNRRKENADDQQQKSGDRQKC